MIDLKTLDLSTLLDHLSEETAIYMKMLKAGATKSDFDKCRLTIQALQVEIEYRRTLEPDQPIPQYPQFPYIDQPAQ